MNWQKIKCLGAFLAVDFEFLPLFPMDQNPWMAPRSPIKGGQVTGGKGSNLLLGVSPAHSMVLEWQGLSVLRNKERHHESNNGQAPEEFFRSHLTHRPLN
jgi:hypothetical protein